MDQGTNRPHLLRAMGQDQCTEAKSLRKDRFQELCGQREAKARGCFRGDEDEPKQNEELDKPLKDPVGDGGKGKRHSPAPRGQGSWLWAGPIRDPYFSYRGMPTWAARTVPITQMFNGLLTSAHLEQPGIFPKS